MDIEKIYSLYSHVYENELKIENIKYRKILNTRGEISYEVIIKVKDNEYFSSAPAGKSTGKHEVTPYPHNWEKYTKEVFTKLKGKTFKEAEEILMKEKNKIGGVISISTSLAFLKAVFDNNVAEGLLNGCKEIIEPKPVGKIFGGGKHAGNFPEFQEFLLVPSTYSFEQSALINAEIYLKIAERLKEMYGHFNYARDFESGWILNEKNETILELLKNNVCSEILLGLDIAASSFYKNGYYIYRDFKLSREEQIEYMITLVKEYNLAYLEDPLHEEDFKGFAEITKTVGNKCLIVGDDLFTTNVERLNKGYEIGACNSILIKPNQIGTFTETLLTIERAKEINYIPIISHRSAITDDPILAHLCIGLRIPYFKCGIAGERIININETIRLIKKIKGGE